MKTKKILAMILAASMTMGLATNALAADPSGSTTGEGSVEFVYNENVFQVELPTVPEGDDTLDFKLDPQKVMDATKDESGITITGSPSLVFTNVAAGTDGLLNTEDDVISYSNTSDSYKIINKSSFDVTVTVDAAIVGEDADAKKAAVTGEDSVEAKFVDTLTSSDPTDAEIVLTLTDGTETDNIDGTTYTAQITFDITAQANAYEVKYDGTKPEGEQYSYDLKSDTDLTDSTFTDETAEIKLTGECNDHTNWTKLEEIKPEVEVTWTVAPKDVTDYDDRNTPAAPAEAAPSLTTASEVALTGTEEGLTITVNFGAGDLAATEITKVTYKNTGGSATNAVTKGFATITDNTVVLTKDFTDTVYGKGTSNTTVITITLDDGTTLTVNLTAAASEG